MDHQQSHIFSYLSPEQRVRKGHPLRAVRAMTDDIFQRMSPLFDAMYAQGGRPSIAPEKLLRALLLQVLYSVRSERMLMEQLDLMGDGRRHDSAAGCSCRIDHKSRQRLKAIRDRNALIPAGFRIGHTVSIAP